MLAEEEADGICAAQEEASAQTVVVAGRRWRRSIRVGKEKERETTTVGREGEEQRREKNSGLRQPTEGSTFCRCSYDSCWRRYIC
jgi:hypothetical protein